MKFIYFTYFLFVPSTSLTLTRKKKLDIFGDTQAHTQTNHHQTARNNNQIKVSDIHDQKPKSSLEKSSFHKHDPFDIDEKNEASLRGMNKQTSDSIVKKYNRHTWAKSTRYWCPAGTTLKNKDKYCTNADFKNYYHAMSIAECKENCISADDRCKYFLYKHEPSAYHKYHCALFHSCRSSHAYGDGDAAITCMVDPPYSCPETTTFFNRDKYCTNADFKNYYDAMSITECKTKCLRDSRCKHFLYKNEPSAHHQYHCALFYGCGSSHTYGDGDAAITCMVDERVPNLALDGTASQSSTSWGGAAERAIDRNVDGKWRSNSVTHTNKENQPWWKVDLGREALITEVRVWNRTDCCSYRLSDSEMRILDSNGKMVAKAMIGNAKGERSFFFSFKHIAGVAGSQVEVKLLGHEALQLAEVQVFGYYKNG